MKLRLLALDGINVEHIFQAMQAKLKVIRFFYMLIHKVLC